MNEELRFYLNCSTALFSGENVCPNCGTKTLWGKMKPFVIGFIIIFICVLPMVVMVALRQPKPTVVVSTQTATQAVTSVVATSTQLPTVTPAKQTKVNPPRNAGWDSIDAYGQIYAKANCIVPEAKLGLTDNCRGETVEIWSTGSSWRVAYESKGTTVTLDLIQGYNKITFADDAFFIRFIKTY